MKKIFICTILAFCGLFISFFLVLASLFSDHTGFDNERIITLVVTGVIYFVLGLLVRYFSQHSFNAYIISFLAPLILPLIYGIKETNMFGYSIMYILIAIVFSLLGKSLASKIKS